MKRGRLVRGKDWMFGQEGARMGRRCVPAVVQWVKPLALSLRLAQWVKDLALL